MRIVRTGASRFVLCCLLATACGCGAAGPRSSQPGAQRGPNTASLKPVGHDRAGSPIVLGRLGDKNVAYVANADDSMLHTLDVDARRELATTELRGAPDLLFLTRDGRLLVSFRERSTLGVFEVGEPNQPLEPVGEVKVPVEPVGLAALPDESALLVTSGWGRALSAYDMQDLERRWQIGLAREPRAVIVTDDGKKAFVSHAVGGRLSVVLLSDPGARARVVRIDAPPAASKAATPGTPSAIRTTKLGRRIARFGVPTAVPRTEKKPRGRVGLQNFALAKSVSPAGRIFTPGVLADPGDIEERSAGYGDVALPHLANVAVIDSQTDQLLLSSVDTEVPITTTLGWGERVAECLLPRAAAVDPKTSALLVACMGLGQVVAFDAGSAAPSSAAVGAWTVAEDPIGIALDPNRQKAFVFSQAERTVNILNLDRLGDADSSTERIELSRKARHAAADLALGRRLFHKVSDRRISNDGRACASCHPDGRDDGLTWATPLGPRQTPTLAGRVNETGPYGWSGLGIDLETHLSHTFQRLRGSGLSERELGALIAYVDSLGLPARRADHADQRAQGEKLFFSSRTGCAACHNGRAFTDGQLHDVGSRAKADPDARFDTPSLLGVGATAPYFHDGRFASLEEMLSATNGRMGKTRHLSRVELDALLGYLESL